MTDKPSSGISDESGWVYDPGQALQNLRRAEVAEAKLAGLDEGLERAARKIADEQQPMEGGDPPKLLTAERVLEILRDEIGGK